VILFLSGYKFLFGWAKPVPVNYSALRKPRQHMAWVAAAGPGANLAMALVWAVLLKLAVVMPRGMFSEFLGLMAQAGILVNLVFMFLNLLPILPLDGGRILASLLPSRAAWQYAKLEPWGLPLLVLLLLTNVLNIVLEPLVGVSDALIRAIVL
jgi:Zn-dependent protease